MADDFIYCYPHSNVLINKLEIRNEEKPFQAEKKLTMLRLLELQRQPVRGDFDLSHLCRIHQYIFQDLYEWAGQIRTVDIAKGTMFCKAEFIEANAKVLFTKLAEDGFQNEQGNETVIKKLAYYFSEINALHPFREGNGRTQREFIKLLAEQNGYDIDFSKITADEMIQASKASILCDYALMEKLFEKCLYKK